MRTERVGDLRVRITGGRDGSGSGDGPLVVLLHGFGAPGDDLVALAPMLGLPTHVRYAFPEAPLPLDDGYGRAWWMLDLALFERRARGERVDRSEDVPTALPSVRGQLAALLEGLETQLAAPRAEMILGGFSQGSMVALDAVLHAEVRPRALVLLSSTLIARPLWEPRMASCAGLPILQTHGTHDPLLDHRDADRLATLLKQAGADLTFLSFPGGHELPPQVLIALARFIATHTT